LGYQAVQTRTNGDKKDYIPVVACVIAAGKKLSVSFIASEKMTGLEESGIDAVEGHWRAHSESERQTSETFESHLMKIHTEMREGRIHLLLDSYSAHRTIAVRKTAASLDITPHFIPRA
jgi:hypothetical protein